MQKNIGCSKFEFPILLNFNLRSNSSWCTKIWRLDSYPGTLNSTEELFRCLANDVFRDISYTNTITTYNSKMNRFRKIYRPNQNKCIDRLFTYRNIHKKTIKWCNYFFLMTLRKILQPNGVTNILKNTLKLY